MMRARSVERALIACANRAEKVHVRPELPQMQKVCPYIRPFRFRLCSSSLCIAA